MTTKDEALKLALEALEYIEHNYMSLPAPAEKAITAIREALAEQPAQQQCEYCKRGLKAGVCYCKPAQHHGPVAYMVWGDNNVPSLTFAKPADKYVFDALYTSPPASKPLTDEDIYKIANDLFYGNGPCDTLAMCRAIEAAHGIKGDA